MNKGGDTVAAFQYLEIQDRKIPAPDTGGNCLPFRRRTALCRTAHDQYNSGNCHDLDHAYTLEHQCILFRSEGWFSWQNTWNPNRVYLRHSVMHNYICRLSAFTGNIDKTSADPLSADDSISHSRRYLRCKHKTEKTALLKKTNCPFRGGIKSL